MHIYIGKMIEKFMWTIIKRKTFKRLFSCFVSLSTTQHYFIGVTILFLQCKRLLATSARRACLQNVR